VINFSDADRMMVKDVAQVEETVAAVGNDHEREEDNKKIMKNLMQMMTFLRFLSLAMMMSMMI